MSNKIKTKAEKREEEKLKLKIKRQKGGTMAGQIQKTRSLKFYKRKKK